MVKLSDINKQYLNYHKTLIAMEIKKMSHSWKENFRIGKFSCDSSLNFNKRTGPKNLVHCGKNFKKREIIAHIRLFGTLE